MDTPVVGTPNRALLLEGPGKVDPATRVTGFGIANTGPTVAYFAGCFKPLLDCTATLEIGTGGGFPAEGAAAITILRGPLVADEDFV